VELPNLQRGHSQQQNLQRDEMIGPGKTPRPKTKSHLPTQGPLQQDLPVPFNVYPSQSDPAESLVGGGMGDNSNYCANLPIRGKQKNGLEFNPLLGAIHSHAHSPVSKQQYQCYWYLPG
jgi:hypothetical protein